MANNQNNGGLAGVLGNIGNWIADTAGAVGNTLKDTYSAITAPGMQISQNMMREWTTNKERELKDKVAQKYGYNSFNDITDEGWQNKDLTNELNYVSEGMKDIRNKTGDMWKNNFFTQNLMNTKQGDYGSNAIKTWNLAADVLTAPFGGPAAQAALNAGQGYLSAAGDELKGKDVVWDPIGDAQGNSTATESFDWGKVGKEGTAQAAGNVVGGLAGAGVGNLGGSLMSNSGSKVGQLAGKAMNSGLTRGAAGGFGAGATTAGLNTAFNGGSLEDILSNAVAGGAEGAKTGAVVGGALSLANRGVNYAKKKYNESKAPQVEAVEEVATEDVYDEDTPEIEQLKKATGWDGEELSLKKRNKLQKAGKALEQTAENIEQADVYNNLDPDTAAKIQRNDSINRLKKLGFSPADYDTASNYSETTNKYIKETIPSDRNLKSTSIVEDLTDGQYNKTTGVIESDKLDTKVKNEVLKSIDNARTDNPNTMDEYNVKKLWDESERLGKIESEYRTKAIKDASTDYGTAAEYLGNVRKEMRAMVDEDIDWGDSFDKGILTERLRSAGADQKNIDNILENADNLADLKRNTSLYEDARTMNNEIGLSKLKRNAITGSSSTNPLNVAASESGINEVLKTVVRPLRGVTGGATKLAGKALEKTGNLGSKIGDSVTSDAGTEIANSLETSNGIAQTNPELLNAALRTTNRGVTSDIVNENRKDTLENHLLTASDLQKAQELARGLSGDYYTGLPTSTTGIATNGLATTGTTGLAGNTLGNANYTTGNTTSTGNNFLDRLSVAMELALEAGDLKAVSDMMDIYNQASKIYGLQNNSDTTTEPKQTKLTSTQQRANAAAASLQRLSNMTPDTGYTVSGIPIIGDLANLQGNSYLSESQSLAQQIGYMVSGANIKKEEAEAIGKAYVPQPFDSEQIRNEKLQRAAEIIKMYQNGYTTEEF